MDIAKKSALEATELAWLAERIQLGSDLSEVINLLRAQGYSEQAIIAGFEATRPRGNALAGGAMQAPPLIRRSPPGLRRIDNPKMDLFTLDGFMSREECAALVTLIDTHLRPSMVNTDYAGANARTSRTAFLAHLGNPLAAAIDDRICRTLGIRASYSEGIQAQRYDVGQEFKPHWDAGLPGTEGHKRLVGLRGNRTWTFMVYLNDDLQGGATRFTDIDVAIQPRTGMAVCWNNLDSRGLPNVATRHSGEPVTAGHKVIITKWFRVHGHGPVLHETPAD